jgi:hypothetical protein
VHESQANEVGSVEARSRDNAVSAIFSNNSFAEPQSSHLQNSGDAACSFTQLKS